MSGAYAGMAMNTAGLAGANRIGVGVGGQNGESALAVGYQRAIGNRASISIGAAFGGGESSVLGGAGFSWLRMDSFEATAPAGRRRSSRTRTGGVSPDRTVESPTEPYIATVIAGEQLRVAATQITRPVARYHEVSDRARE